MRESEVVKNLNTFLFDKGLNYANEIRMGIGIPDVMIGFDIDNAHPNIANYYTLSIYNLLKRNEGKSFKEILKTSNLTPREIKQSIGLLEELGIVTMEDSSIAVKDINLEHSGTTISIEVKVKDWKLGLLQAQRYLQFSDYSYLALPVEHIANVDKREVRKYGIGLLSVDNDVVIELIKPKISKKCDSISKYISISSLIDKISKTSNKIDDNFFENTSMIWD
ncbi:hypothetical protein K8A91_12935 [Listeria monocytogenes]|uniref:hypothetical protein n=1 Tax=Listeria monocytogenes TaxID=1639 RepID=UPI0010B85CCC|nr:hypothetical protein [Listeria monocytogenes]EAC5804399.1 hypothetical protein [Listeria monocytogenes]EAC9482232.1 hypothetical protein [Listeria monocytogenes]EHL5826350.1 hypothetical protein [Listeria monocytogenes]EKC6210758.1 hypothetical protein [Listeria monocytogenes]MCD1687575.1 hypothetical protein [Listeria monocytogenes]